MVRNFLYSDISSIDVFRIPVENSKRPLAAAFAKSESGIKDSRTRQILEKNIMQKHTEIIFWDAFVSDSEKISPSGVSVVVSTRGGELCLFLL